MKRKILIFLFFCLFALSENRVGWLIYPYNLVSLSEDEYNRFLNCKEAEYLGIQVNLSYGKIELLKKSMEELTKNGKKIIVQLWWGAGPPFSWERYNFPNISFDTGIRDEFFKIIDDWIEYIGPKNIYGIHFLEETGMQFGWDISIPARPEKDDDGYHFISNYDCPANFIWSRSISGPNVLTIKKYNEIFIKETGLDMRYYPVWTPEEMEIYKNWVQTRMEAGAHINFAKHIHNKYPNIKVYAWNSGIALIPQSKVLDGLWCNPYTHTIWVYMSLRSRRQIMKENQELLAMVWGNREKSEKERLIQQAVSYLAGSNILSTFGDRELKDDNCLEIVKNSVKPFLGLPVFKSNPELCVLAGENWGATLRDVSFWITGFSNYDVCYPYMDDVIDLNSYKIIFSWGRWNKNLKEWIKNGGILISVNPPFNFLDDEGFIKRIRKYEKKSFEYKPSERMKEILKLKSTYSLNLEFYWEIEVLKQEVIEFDHFIYLIPYGNGYIVLLNGIPYVGPPWKYEEYFEIYRQLLTDICRGVLIFKGKKDIAEKCFNNPEFGNDYFCATSSDGKIKVYILNIDIHGNNKTKTEFVVKGKDRITGKMDVKLNYENPVVVIEKE